MVNPRSARCERGGEARKQFFFEKKEPKNFYSLRYEPNLPAATTNRIKFLVLFFQKRTASLLPTCRLPVTFP
jgi:hypothetical protein